MKINEIILSTLKEPTEHDLEKFKNSNNLKKTGVLAGYELFSNTFDNQQVYFYQNNNEIIGYAIIELKQHSNKKFWWLLELWIKNNPIYRKKGLATGLVRYIKDEKEILMIDEEMSFQAYKLIKKMIYNGLVTARIVDISTGDAEEYHPGEDLTKEENANKVFVLEDYRLREGILQKMTILNYLDIKGIK